MIFFRKNHKILLRFKSIVIKQNMADSAVDFCQFFWTDYVATSTILSWNLLNDGSMMNNSLVFYTFYLKSNMSREFKSLNLSCVILALPSLFLFFRETDCCCLSYVTGLVLSCQNGKFFKILSCQLFT